MSPQAETPKSPQPTPSMISESISDANSLSEFLFDSAAIWDRAGMCIRRSNGRLYAIKKTLQTRRTWTELTILRKIREHRVLFNQWLYWAFERDRCIYFIVVSTFSLPLRLKPPLRIYFIKQENCPSGSLADAVMHNGMLGSSAVFFFACEMVRSQLLCHVNTDIQFVGNGFKVLARRRNYPS